MSDTSQGTPGPNITHLSVDDPAGWPVDKMFGHRVREMRLYNDLTQRQLAERMTRLGMSMVQSTIAEIEAGTRPARLHEAVELARFFGVHVGDLLYDATMDPELRGIYHDLLGAQAREQVTRKAVDDARRALMEAETNHRAAGMAAVTLRERYQQECARRGEKSYPS